MQRTHVTANKSSNNNVEFYFVSDLRIVHYNNYKSTITIQWTRAEKYFVSLIWRQHHSKQCNQNFAGTLTILYRKARVIIWYTNFKQQAKNPRSQLTARCPDNVDVVRDSIGTSPKKSLRRRSQELGLSMHRCTQIESWSTINSHKPIWSFLSQWLITIILLGCVYFETPYI